MTKRFEGRWSGEVKPSDGFLDPNKFLKVKGLVSRRRRVKPSGADSLTTQRLKDELVEVVEEYLEAQGECTNATGVDGSISYCEDIVTCSYCTLMLAAERLRAAKPSAWEDPEKVLRDRKRLARREYDYAVHCLSRFLEEDKSPDKSIRVPGQSRTHEEVNK